MSEFVLDASACMSVMAKEEGWQKVLSILPRSCISTVNISEIAAKISERGGPVNATRVELDCYQMLVIPFDQELAYRAAALRPLTRSLGLSFGDRACLALGQAMNLPVVTAERAWAALDIGISIEIIR